MNYLFFFDILVILLTQVSKGNKSYLSVIRGYLTYLCKNIRAGNQCMNFLVDSKHV